MLVRFARLRGPFPHHAGLLGRFTLTCLSALLVPVLAGAGEITGEQIYREQCAVCHGEKGEGTEDSYPNPLAGDRPLAELAKLIDETMPEGEPEVLSAEDSAKVAAYIYDAFYSPDAQARNKPPRIELSRLTVRQYRNAVADLVGSFAGSGTWDDQRGLEASYYDDRRSRRDKMVIRRRDATIDFDFGTSSPDAEKIGPHQFAIEWEGSVFAPETGEYEFVVRSEHAARLWVNDPDRPLIDAYVKSGDDTEYRATITLLGGRAYPLRMEFSKATQGVN
ncbi:MAG TPA: PA14 domain-containing protein, partial [Planctomycetaceae bacterium]